MFDVNSEKPTHCVLYTDGGCWQDLRIGGWGVHGYFFINEPAKVGSGCKKAKPCVDGYENGSSGKTDITLTHYVDAFRSLPAEATNNVAELSAGIRAMELIVESGVTDAVLISDSKYFLQGLTEWLKGWVANKWVSSTGKPVANRELWERIAELRDEIAKRNINVKYKWIKGHSGDLGNDIVDKLSSLSMRAALNGRPVDETSVSDAKGYWKTSKKQSRLLNLPAWYFGVRTDAAVLSEDNRTIYYQGHVRDGEDFNGKMISDACFSVIYMTEPDPVLETIRTESMRLAKASFYGLAVADLKVIFHPENYELIEQYGIKFLTYDLAKNRLQNFRKEVLVEERRPVRRAYYAVDRLTHLEKILQSYIRLAASKDDAALSSATSDGLTYTDVTDILYEPVAGKRSSSIRLRPDITQAVKYLDIDADYTLPSKNAGKAKVRLVLGQDLPDRNTLSALAEEIVKVVVVTWADSECAIRFATILQTNHDVGIWSGVYSNLTLLPTP